MGSMCGPGNYKAKESMYIVKDDDYLAKDLTQSYLSMNSSTPIESLYPSTKKILNINDSTSFSTPSPYYHKQAPPTSSEQFADPVFPANSHSLLYLRPGDNDCVTQEEIDGLKVLHWEKPKTLFRNNRYVLYDTIDVEDVQQGSLGNCYFLSVLSTLATCPDIYDKVFIDKERTENGCYRVRFLIRGIPKIVCVDDSFPADSKNMFAFAMSGRRELWVQVLEKAWAKVNQSYAGTIAGLPSEAFSALSEAPCVTYFHKRYTPDKIWSILKREKTKGFFIATNTSAMNPELEKEIGLVSGHAYSITNLYEFEIPNNNPDPKEKNKPKQALRLVQLRNPWSYYEWKGDFCDDSEKWNMIPDLKQKVGLVNKDDGLFFMDFNDFLKYYYYTYVLKYHKKSSYNYKKLHQQSTYHMAACKIILKHNQHINVGIHLKQERFYSKVVNYRVPAARIIVAKYDSKAKKYVFIGSDFGTNDVLYAETDFKLEPGEYHVFLNANWPYDTPISYTVSTYSQYPVDIIELKREEIPQNYLEQIFIDYLDKNTKKKVLSRYCQTQFSDIDNNTGFYMFLITNNSNKKFIFRANFLYFGAEMCQSEFIKARDFELKKQQKVKVEYIKDLVECPLMPHERRLLLWRMTKNPFECKISVEKRTLFDYKEDVFDIKDIVLYEKIRDMYSNLKKNLLVQDIEYTEVETSDMICVVFRNVTKEKKNYLLEVSFSELVNVEPEDGIDNVLILKCEQCRMLKLRKTTQNEKCNFKFTYSYAIVTKNEKK